MAKTILDKLNIKNDSHILCLNMPTSVTELQHITMDYTIQNTPYDCIFYFVFSLDAFEQAIDQAASNNLLTEGGYLHLIYPKKNNKHYDTYIHRDHIMTIPMDEERYFKNTLLKFSKLLSFNDTFTICSLRHLKKATKKSTKPSQCVADYEHKVDDLKTHFTQQPDVLEIYEGLTPGYQRDWARYIYSAKTQTTIDKRLLEMADILRQGFKTKNLYNQSKKSHK